MTKCENLGQLIGMSAEMVEQNIDKEMWDILIALNERGYNTVGCCAGHPDTEGNWNGYIYFAYPYVFSTYPSNFSVFRNNRRYFEWDGTDEESRKEFLNSLLEWALMLPYKAPIEKRCYTLMGKNKNRPNSREKVLINTYDFEDIKAILNRRDMSKYELRMFENVIERY